MLSSFAKNAWSALASGHAYSSFRSGNLHAVSDELSPGLRAHERQATHTDLDLNDTKEHILLAWKF